ncbi:MAG: hypothetical protein ACFFCM_19830 [Promethearchaeota archaeon]
MAEKLKNKFFLAAIGCLLISAYLILAVLVEFVFLGMGTSIPMIIFQFLLIAVGFILMGIGLYEYYKDINQIVAWGMFIVSIVTVFLLLTYNALRLWNMASHLLYSYLGYISETLKPIAKIFGFKYSEINFSIHGMFGVSAIFITIVFAALGFNSIWKRVDRSNEQLSLIAGLLTIVAIVLFIITFAIYWNARAAQLSFSMNRAYLSISGLGDTPSLLGFSTGTVLTGIDWLFIDPEVGDIYNLYILLGLLPLGIINVINGLCFLKESE